MQTCPRLTLCLAALTFLRISMAGPLFDEMVQRAAQKYPLQDSQGTITKPTEESKLAKILFLTGMGADIGTTAYGTAQGLLKEDNPLINWAGPKWQLPIGAAMETGGYLLAKKLLAK